MNERNEWEIERLHKRLETQDEKIEKQDEEISDLIIFRTETIERLRTLFNRIQNIEKSNKWVSQTFYTLILSGLISMILAFVNWVMNQ